ncbi:nucleotide/nucleic acid binding protein [Perilla frutescens var. hirtella]|nr:nucleotide/nucleic acid binding protein [Perilla frutescens var. hirtella]
MAGPLSSIMKHANIDQTTRSRICVKNLPRYVSEDRLREFFSQKGEITDVKLMRKKDGTSRQFAFVGYRTVQEADEAIKYFTNSFMDTCKLTCEIARKVGDPEIPRPWSLKKHQISKDEKMLVGSKGSEVGDKKDEYHNDLKFQEFLQVMQQRSKSKLWENDVPVASFLEISRGTSDKKLNLLESKHAVLKNVVKEDILKQNAADGSTKEYSNKISDSITPSNMKDENEEILKTGRLFILNLPYVATEEEVEKHFSIFGDISEVHLVVDRDTKISKGRAYVDYVLPESAARALEELNNSSFQGRVLKIMPAEEKKNYVPSNFTQQSSKTFKQLQNEKRKASESMGDTRGWNSLFMSTNTVTENIARKFGVSKSVLLDREAKDVPVRITLGESGVIAETKKAFSRAGVDVAALELASGEKNCLKRSRVILVKNLPYCSSASELADMFGKFGNLDKVILPPTKTLALVIFIDPADAYASFNGLRYKCYKGVPLYLQFLPETILSQTPISESNSNNSVVAVEHDTKRVLLDHQLDAIIDLDVDSDRIESRSLFVKNLNFKTSDEGLKRHFTDHMTEGRVLSVRIKKVSKNGKNMSGGFGFIEFDSVDTAVRACRDLQGTNLDGFALKLQLCQAKKVENDREVDSNRSSTKFIVKNIAFEATKKDLKDLFSPFGQLKSLRVPKRYGNHRGFAFVEYTTKQEAASALEHLGKTHLYGRHLVGQRTLLVIIHKSYIYNCLPALQVFEVANKAPNLEELRARTASQFTDSKLSKKRKYDPVLDEGNVEFKRLL